MGNQNDASTELNLSHILIPLPENPTSDQVNEAESRARAIVDQARNGADFGKLAIAHSADQQALNGGQMGWGRIQELRDLRPGIKHREERRHCWPDSFRRWLPYSES